jgi:hypothetical protein
MRSPWLLRKAAKAGILVPRPFFSSCGAGRGRRWEVSANGANHTSRVVNSAQLIYSAESIDNAMRRQVLQPALEPMGLTFCREVEFEALHKAWAGADGRAMASGRDAQ